MKINESELISKAYEIMKNSYAPYSKFNVGACLLTKNGKFFQGTNVENVSYGMTMCAERNAIFSAVNNGEKEFLAIAIIANNYNDYIKPCGACLQVMSEFSKDLIIICCKTQIDYKIYKLSDLMPMNFSL